MPVTLAQASLSSQSDVQAGVIDEFRRSSFLLDNLTFDDTVSPGTNQATLTYGYSRLITPGSAAFRALNAEYTPQEATTQQYSVNLKIFGGSFQIDRVIADMGGLYSLLQLQIEEKVKAAACLFHDTFINGDTAVDANAFDGANKAVAGSSTEYNADGVIDLSTGNAMTTGAQDFLDALDAWLSTFSERPTFIGGNRKSIGKVKSIARRAGYSTKTEDAFGRTVDTYDGIPLIDLGDKSGSSNPVVPIQTRTIGGNSTTGLTDLYAASLSLTGVHGACKPGQNGTGDAANQRLIRQYLPDLKAPGAVKTGEAEMVAALIIKKTKAIGALRNLKV